MNEEQQQPQRVVISAGSGGWGGGSLLFCIVGALVCMGGGLSLISIKAASDNNLFQAIANGIGWYCLGKGIFMLAAAFQARGAIFKLLGR